MSLTDQVQPNKPSSLALLQHTIKFNSYYYYHISVCMSYSQLLCKLSFLLSNRWYDLQEEYCEEYIEDGIQYALVSFQSNCDGTLC